jgi:hypothetical protein
MPATARIVLAFLNALERRDQLTYGFRVESDKASITVPNASKLRLIYLPSANLSISETAFSLPARSIKVYSVGLLSAKEQPTGIAVALTNLDRRTSVPSRLSTVYPIRAKPYDQ